jgi:hypothetical protein
MAKYFFVLGASDREMDAIVEVLQTNGVPWVYATNVTRERFVRAGEDGLLLGAPGPLAGETLVSVEVALGNATPEIEIDHHNNDRASWGPDRYWQASSLGQVCTLLGVVPTSKMRVVAALDHCLAAALAGRCPGVDPEAPVTWATILDLRPPGLSREEFGAQIQRSVDLLRGAPLCPDIPGVRDLTALDPGAPGAFDVYPPEFRHGPLAAAVARCAYLVRGVRPDGTQILRIGGAGEGSVPGVDPILTWMIGAGVARGCYPADHPRPDNLYGFPTRGMGGGTLR